MKNIKNSNLKVFLKSIYFLLSVGIHLLLILYPLKLINEELDMIDPLSEKVKEIDSQIEIQVVKSPKETISFKEVLDNSDGIEKANDSSIISDKNRKKEEQNIDKEDDIDLIAEKKAISLDTVRFKYFDYYIKIKKQVDQQWQDNIFSYLDGISKINKTLQTEILLKVNSEGSIVEKEISESSGSKELDKIGLKTFDNLKIPMPPSALMNGKEFIYLYWKFSINI